MNATQPTVCVTLKLTCQPDFADLSVNGGNAVHPYLETVLTAQVPKSYSIKKAFIIHVLANDQPDAGFPLFNSPTTSCIAHPGLVPCADFTLSKDGDPPDHRPHPWQRRDALLGVRPLGQ